ncbi:MAG: DNA polymerase III subunit delta [Deltaproteobacteria bacterium]|nr:DNA polymerase III subunit delta [Deltaproteobacteria bacterium]
MTIRPNLMDLIKLNTELRAKKFSPCYLLAGPERHLVLTAQRQILNAVFGGTPQNVDRFSFEKTKPASVVDSLNTASLLSPKRVVVVEEADRLKKADWEILKDYLAKPNPQSVLVLIAESIKPGDLKSLSSKTAIVECKKLYPNQLPQWINMEAKNSGAQISQEAARFLGDLIGADLGAIHQSLEKLLLFVGNRGLIQLEDVEKVIANTAQKNVFDMTNAIGAKKPVEALQFLNNILEQGEMPIRIFAMILRHFRLLAKAQEVLAKSGSNVQTSLAKELGVNPYFAKDYAVQAKRFRPRGWGKRFETLAESDRALKSSRLKSQAVLEKLILRLCKDAA